MNNDAFASLARRAALRKLAAAGALGAGGIGGLIGAALAADGQPGIRRIQGMVTVDGQPAAVGQQIRHGQTVVTQGDSEAVFVIGQDAFLQRENSTFVIEEGAGVTVLRYVAGKILSVFGKGSKQLQTPNAVIGIRGTGCYIEIEPGRTYFCLCYGEAVVTPNAPGAQGRTLRTTHHEHPLYIGGPDGPAAMEAATAINHNDDELIMLEALVGRRPPFEGKKGGYRR